MTLERIVRPFQTDTITPPKPIPTNDATSTPNNVVINPGVNGSAKTMSGSTNITITYYHVRKPKEKRKAADPSLEMGAADQTFPPNVSNEDLANQYPGMV